MRIHRLVTVIAILVAAACGGDDDGAPSISVSEKNICSEVAEVACYNLYSCCDEGRIELELGVDEPRTEAQCRDDMRLRCERSLASREWSLEKGRVTFAGDVMGECLEALIAPRDSCSLIETETPWAQACKPDAWKGAVADGQECYYEFECGANSYCAPNRKCTALPVENQACSAVGCAPGHYCDVTTCKKLVAENGTCTSSPQCAEGLYCDVVIGGSSTCKPLIATGIACKSDTSCKSKDCLQGACVLDPARSCFQDSDCFGRCDNNPTQPCSTAAECGLARCSISRFSCTLPTDCTGGPGDVCVQPACKGADCNGEPVCVDGVEQVDFCEESIDALPVGDPPRRPGF